MRVGDKNARRSIVLGEGTLRSLPPVFREGASSGTEALSWEGEVRCAEDFTVGSFEAGLVTVKVRLGFASPFRSPSARYRTRSLRKFRPHQDPLCTAHLRSIP